MRELVVVPAPGGAFHVARAVEALSPDPEGAAEVRDRLRTQLGPAIAADLVRQYDDALQSRHGVAINDRAFEQALAQATQALPVPANL